VSTKKATIKDVAREANVSIASVSRVLNGLGGVTVDTQDAVRKAAAKLKLTDRSDLRSLITGRTQQLDLF